MSPIEQQTDLKQYPRDAEVSAVGRPVERRAGYR